jgi:hypothetical protein
MFKKNNNKKIHLIIIIRIINKWQYSQKMSINKFIKI